MTGKTLSKSKTIESHILSLCLSSGLKGQNRFVRFIIKAGVLLGLKKDSE